MATRLKKPKFSRKLTMDSAKIKTILAKKNPMSVFPTKKKKK